MMFCFNNTEMQFLNGIFSRGPGHKNLSSQARVFVWFSNLIFRPTKCYSWKDSSFLAVDHREFF